MKGTVNMDTKEIREEIAKLQSEIEGFEADLLDAPFDADPATIQEIAQDIVNATHEIQDLEYRLEMHRRPVRAF